MTQRPIAIYKIQQDGDSFSCLTAVAFSSLELIGLVGAGLSEPHTSVTALAEVVCMYVCGHIP